MLLNLNMKLVENFNINYFWIYGPIQVGGWGDILDIVF